MRGPDDDAEPRAASQASGAVRMEGVFGRQKKSTQDPSPESVKAQEAAESARRTEGKGRPTPTRRERQAARKRPLIPQDRQAAKKAEREAAREARIRQNQAMQTGDERYLPARDRGPQRRYIRDFVDARRNVGDYFLILLMATFVVGLLVRGWQPYTVVIMWGLIFLFIIDAWVAWRKVKARIIEKFGAVEPGSGWYCAQRVMMIRRLRLPKPQVRRGEYPA